MVEPRTPHPTVQFVDTYCQMYRHLFPELRSFEAFKYLHVGLISDIKRKTLPAIAKVVGLENEQSLHHFLTESPWKAKDLKQQRLEIILRVLSGRSIILIIDDTGDKKQGHTTDYVKRQYIGNLGKTENGIVAVTAYGYVEGITLPLTFEVYKPKERLKEDKYLTRTRNSSLLLLFGVTMQSYYSQGKKLEAIDGENLNEFLATEARRLDM